MLGWSYFIRQINAFIPLCVYATNSVTWLWWYLVVKGCQRSRNLNYLLAFFFNMQKVCELDSRLLPLLVLPVLCLQYVTFFHFQIYCYIFFIFNYKEISVKQCFGCTTFLKYIFGSCNLGFSIFISVSANIFFFFVLVLAKCVCFVFSS